MNALRCRCPNCARGPVFSGWLNQVRPQCSVCGLSYFPESGYYMGGMILTYVLTAALLIVTYLFTLAFPRLGAAPEDVKFPLWLGFGVLVSLLLVRPSYSLWLTIGYRLDPWGRGEVDWREKRKQP